MNTTLALFITFLLGLFIVLGALLAFFFHKKQAVLDFLFALALSLIAMLIVTDLLPEIMEVLGLTYLWLFLICVAIGFFLFKILDEFIPEHHHEDEKLTKKQNQKNMTHIGVLTTIALIIHNIIEGLAIFITASNDLSLGIMMSLGVGLHNIPLGMIISTTFYQSEEKKNKLALYLTLLCLSTFFGGSIGYLCHLKDIPNLAMGSLLSITLGMLSYIAFMELWPRIKETKNQKMTITGLITGLVLLIATLFLK